MIRAVGRHLPGRLSSSTLVPVVRSTKPLINACNKFHSFPASLRGNGSASDSGDQSTKADHKPDLSQHSDMNGHTDDESVTSNVLNKAPIDYEQGAYFDDHNPKTGKVTSRRQYFYYIDHQGQLFLDDMRVKNFITAYKDRKFLDFFFKRVQWNRTKRFDEHFTFISPCGPEVNYIRVEDRPIVFVKLVTAEEPTGPEHTHDLIWGGTMRVPFRPDQLVMLLESGRMYHPAPNDKTTKLALVKSAIAVNLGESISFDDNGSMILQWQGEKYPIRDQMGEDE
eukprot:Clim_evm43s227 gene=Clim_evmTU43s227